MSKRILFAVVFGMVSLVASFADVKAADGVYFAQGEFGQTGWKSQVVISVKSGKIVKAVWNGVSTLPGGLDKKTWAASGKYGMGKAAKQGDWDKQSLAVENWLVKTQDVDFASFSKDGKTDAISGATMSVAEFFVLAKKALSGAPVAKGIYKNDGWFYAAQPDFDAKTGWKDSVLVTVVNGSVVDVLWNGANKDAAKKSKLVESTEGRYGMGSIAKKGEWHVQAAAVQAAIVAAQDPAKIAVKADGTTDAISGASLHVTAVSLAAEALKAAR